jgi:adenylyltransferase/sulfurtransferase
VSDDRHARQILFRHVGAAGQERLRRARVLVVGLGATGGAIANSLARSGVGRLTLVDRDYPERHNLQRQTLLDDEDVERGTPKALASRDHLLRVDPGLDIRAVVADVHAGNILELVGDHDVVVDGTDNFATRFVLNDAALKLGRPWVYSGVIGAHGASMTIEAGGRPCLRCLYPDVPPAGSVETCDTAGVLHPAVEVVAGVAALEVMKLLLDGQPRNHGLLYLDVWEGTFERFRVPAQAECASCALQRYPALEERSGGDVIAAALCGREAVHLRPPVAAVDLAALADRLANSTAVACVNEHLLRFTAEGHEVTLFADGRAIVKGTADVLEARALYARYVGT